MRPSSIRSPISPALAVKYQPSKHSFFTNLVNTSPELIYDPSRVTNLYVSLGAPLHAIRCGVYHLPIHNPDLRSVKLKFIEDSDSINEYDPDEGVIVARHTHHELFRDLFARMGSRLAQDRVFDNLFYGDPLCMALNNDISQIVGRIIRNYKKSIGGFCLFEEVSHDWVKGLYTGLRKHFPQLNNHPYFVECMEARGIDRARLLIQHIVKLNTIKPRRTNAPYSQRATALVNAPYSQRAIALINVLEGLPGIKELPGMDHDFAIGESADHIEKSAEEMGQILNDWLDLLNKRLEPVMPSETIESYDDLLAIKK